MQETKETDAALVQAYIAGNNNAFDLLVKRHGKSLFGYIFNIIKEKDSTNDVYQDTLTNACVALKSTDLYYQEVNNFKGWIFTIAHNVAINAIRKRNRLLQIDDWDPYKGILLSGNELPNLEREEILSNIQYFLESLPQEFMEPFYLCFFLHFKYHEIAEFLDLPIGTIKSRIHFARKQLLSFEGGSLSSFLRKYVKV